MTSSLPLIIRSICPYCTASQDIIFTKSYPQAVLAQCLNPVCVKHWHEGNYLTAVLQIEQFTTYGRGVKQPPLYQIRTKGRSGLIRLLALQTSKDVVFKKGDTISISIRKQATGRFRKQWTGQWEQQPTIFFNSSLDFFWILDN